MLLRDSNWAHIACHGIQHPTRPLESSFCLADARLSVSDLMNLNLKDAVFAFLSACETAKGDTEQPDQVIHLAAAMLFVGFKSVVATMW
jgi:CHAT domain-containing protein